MYKKPETWQEVPISAGQNPKYALSNSRMISEENNRSFKPAKLKSRTESHRKPPKITNECNSAGAELQIKLG